MFIYPIYNHNWRNISTIYIHITRLASNKIFWPSNKIHWEVGQAKDLSAPLYDRQNRFKSRQETLDDKPRSRRTSTSVRAETIPKFQELVHASQQLVNEVGILCGSAQTILTELLMKWDEKRWMLNHNTAASHTAMAAQQFLAEKQTALWLQAPYSAPCDFGSSLY